MKKNYRSLDFFILTLSVLVVLFSLASCEKEDIDFNTGFIDNSITNLVLVDSSTVDVSTVYVDSFITSSSGAILAGKFKDEQFGTVSSQSFLQIGLPSASYDIPTGSVFDSLEVILKLNKNFYGDTSSNYALSIYQLSEPIIYPSNQYAFYNTSTLAYNTRTALGSSQFVVSPSTRDTIAIKISSILGKDLFDRLQAKDPGLLTAAQFYSYFKGLAIIGGADNNLLLGFKDSLTMRMHYHKPDVFENKANIDFGISESNYQFNNITTNKAGTAIAALGANNKILPSSATQHAGFSQYISGSVVKLRFPYLKNLYQLPNFVKIIRAELLIKPVQNSFLGFYPLPPELRLSATDQNNLPGTDLTAATATTSAVQYGNLYIDNLYGTSTEYEYDVTSYLQSMMANTETNQNGLLVLPPSPTTTFNRLLVADGSVTNNKTQVKIYYASVK